MRQQSTPLRILVVDDDTMSRELLGVLLEGEGYLVDSADSGAAALALLARGTTAPDLVLTDVQMPGDTASGLAGKLRRACPPGTRLLAMSGSQPPQKTISRFDGFLLKPFTMKDVAAAVLALGRPQNVEKPAPKWEPRAVAGTLSSLSASRSPQTKSNNLMGPDRQEPQSSLPAAGSEISPVLNETIYQRLASAMPARQLHEMYALCVQDARERITLMRGLIAAHDDAHFIREAHAIKGSCGMLGATQLHALAAELERNGLEAAPSPATPEVNSLDELSDACDRLERMLGSRV